MCVLEIKSMLTISTYAKTHRVKIINMHQEKIEHKTRRVVVVVVNATQQTLANHHASHARKGVALRAWL